MANKKAKLVRRQEHEQAKWEAISKTHECSLCGVTYRGWGNNAQPFEGRCCNECNDTLVIPARLALMLRRKDVKNEDRT